MLRRTLDVRWLVLALLLVPGVAQAQGGDFIRFTPAGGGGATTPATAASIYLASGNNAGWIYKAGAPFLFTYADPTSDGLNFFLGTGAGNQTMGPSGGASNLGAYNFCIGNNCLHSVTTGHHNFGAGSGTLEDLTTGIDNYASGYIAGRNVIDGNYNYLTGNDSGQALTSGSYNSASGVMSLYSETTGSGSTAYGYHSLYSQNGGAYSTVVGASSGTSVTTGQYITALGTSSCRAVTTASRTVCIGPEAGYYETGAYKVFLDSRDRGSEANGRLYSLIYGVVDPTNTMTGQYLYLNAGHVSVRHLASYANNAAALAGGLVAGDLYMVTGSDPRQIAVTY